MQLSHQSKFSRYDLTEQQVAEGSILSELQEAVIQNLIADCAEAKIQITVTRITYDEYWQQEASYAGQIAILQSILDTSKELKEKAAQAAANLPPDQAADSVPLSGGLPSAIFGVAPSEQTPFDNLPQNR